MFLLFFVAGYGILGAALSYGAVGIYRLVEDRIFN
jgi:hypothetical protein